ncbi:MAG: TetR/AcrR family transcriptional regulator [Ectothiorhodospiraceae bacterium]|nr:TetR/AcrR family transcriptional regulator [Ectothiorhodospiraceae bacterium]MCH8503985.1 TetR/AcrR family transcriptional regulator [Ectothiorhodospiraceae bacterium]
MSVVTINRRRRTQAERTEESGQRMVDAGIRLILEKGPQKTTLREVGELAGYSRGLAGYHFGSKEGLFREILTHSRKQWVQELNATVGSKRGLEAMLAATDAFRRFLHKAPDHYRAMLLLWYESVGHASPVSAKLVEHHAAQRRDVKRWVEEGIVDGEIADDVDAEAVAAGFCSLMLGTVYQWQVNPKAFDLDRAFEEYKRWLTLALQVR